MDFKKSLEASIIPIVALVVIGILQIALGLVLQGTLALAMCIVGAVILLISITIYLWAGYNSVKKFNMDIAGAALTGAITGLIAGSVNLVINLIVLLLFPNSAANAAMMGFGNTTFGNATALAGTAAAGGVNAYVCLCGVVEVAITIIIGAVLAAIGAVIAGKK
jgi:hypothetical protein